MTEQTEHAADGNASYLAMISFIAALGGFLFGFDTAVVSGTLEYLRPQFELTSLMEGVVVSAALVGCMLGALLAGNLSDRFGRKPILILSAVLFLISAIGSAIPPTVALLIGARLIGGVGVGMASMLSPLYLSEMSPPNLRGRLVAFYQLAITIGILIAYFSNVWLQRLSTGTLAGMDQGVWRWILVDEVSRAMFAIEAIPAAAFWLLLLLVPETPRWLSETGPRRRSPRHSDAHRRCERVRTRTHRDSCRDRRRERLDRATPAARAADGLDHRDSASAFLADQRHQCHHLLWNHDLSRSRLGTQRIAGRTSLYRIREHDFHIRGDCRR